MDTQLWGLILEDAGTIMVAYMALRVHHRVRQEHNISKKVAAIMGLEQKLGLLGIILIIMGFLLQLNARFQL